LGKTLFEINCIFDIMISKNLEEALNQQVAIEASASFIYLAMASWMENEGFEGTARFLYAQSDEERMHMMKLFHYINEVGGYALSPQVSTPDTQFESYNHVFLRVLDQEKKVTAAINRLMDIATKEGDHTTANFLQWYVAEQREEEAQFHAILNKLKILGNDGSGLYLIDRDLDQLAATASAKPAVK
jgi:ferritin